MQFLTAIMFVLGIASTPSFPMPEGIDEVAADAFRHSAVNVESYENSNQTDLVELRERASANATRSLSNTSLADLQNDNLTQQMQIRYRERKRQERLMLIQSQILQRLRMSEQPNISASGFSEEEQRRIDAFLQRMHQLDNHPSSQSPFVHHHHHQRRQHWQDADRQMRLASTRPLHNLHTIMQRFQSFYPSCSPPNNTDQNSCEVPGLFRVYYDFPSSRFWLNGDVTVLMAKLRLFKFGNNNLQNSLESMVQSSSTTINVSIYQYLRPLKRNKRERKRLVDSKMLSVDYEGWVEFDVASSVNVWLYHRNRNFGLVVEVQDIDGNRIDANQFFRNRNCSLSETAREPPFPNIIELHPEMASRDNESSIFDNETFPTLDLQTAEVSLMDDMATFNFYRDDTSATVIGPAADDVNRSRRSVITESPEDNEPLCQEELLYVSFQELDMDNVIISPKGFDWTFCSGRCEADSKEIQETVDKKTEDKGYNDFLQKFRSIWGLVRPKKSTFNSQCIEVDKRPLTLLYSDGSNGPILATLENFVPTRCTCKSS